MDVNRTQEVGGSDYDFSSIPIPTPTAESQDAYEVNLNHLREKTRQEVQVALTGLKDRISDGFTASEASLHLDSCFKSAQVNVQNADVVLCFQVLLKSVGLYNSDLDGRVGPKTKNALKRFQAKNNLRRTQEFGSFGPQTLAIFTKQPLELYSAQIIDGSAERLAVAQSISDGVSGALPLTYTRNQEMIKSLFPDFTSFQLSNPDVRLSRGSKTAGELKSSIDSAITNLYLDSNEMSPKQRFKAFQKIEPQIRSLLEIYKRASGADQGYLKAYISLRRMHNIVTSKMPRSDRGRDVSLIRTFDIPQLQSGALILVKKLSPILRISSKIRDGENLTTNEKSLIYDSLNFFARDEIGRILIDQADVYLEDIKFLLPHIASPNEKKKLQSLIKVLEGFKSIKRFVNQLVAQNEPNVIATICLKAAPALLSLAAAVTAIPTGGASVAVASLVAGSVAGVGATEVGNVVSDRIGQAVYGELYETQSFLEGYLSGEVSFAGLLTTYSKEILTAIAFDFLALKGSAYLQKSLTKLFTSLADAPGIQQEFIQQMKALGVTTGRLGKPLTHAQSESLLKFVDNITQSINAQTTSDALGLLISQSLWLAKGAGLQNHLKLDLNLDLDALKSSDDGSKLKYEYTVDESKSRSLLTGLKTNLVPSGYTIQEGQSKITATLTKEGRTIELVFKLKPANAEFIKFLDDFIASKYPPDYINLHLDDDGYLNLRKMTSGTMDITGVLELQGYTVEAIQTENQSIRTYRVTNKNPFTDQKIRIIPYGEGFDTHS